MKKLFRFSLFILIFLSFGFLSKSLVFASAPAYPLCGTCPGGGLPGYSSNSLTGEGCNQAQFQYQATWCSYEGNTCTIPVAKPTLNDGCTGVAISQIPNANINQGSLYIYSSGSFTDQFSGPYIATVDYGDGTGAQPLTLNGNNFSLNHTYQSVGVYNVTVTISDTIDMYSIPPAPQPGLPASVVAQVNVINVAPTASSYLLGGGLLNLRPGTLSPSGKLAFGVAVGYSRGSQTPSGVTVIASSDLKFNFVITAYQWLIVSGNTAFLQATGKINGSGNYTLLLAASQAPKNGGSAMIRLQIKNSLTNSVFYDSQPGSPTYAAPTTPVANGFITVHN